MPKVSNVTFGMAFKAAVESANRQGLYDPDSVSAKFVELLTILERVAPDYGVDLNDASYGGSSKSEKKERELPAGASVFNVDGETWIDFRGSKDIGKDKGGVIAKHPDFKTFDYKTSVWMFAEDGTPNEEAAALVTAADKAALV